MFQQSHYFLALIICQGGRIKLLLHPKPPPHLKCLPKFKFQLKMLTSWQTGCMKFFWQTGWVSFGIFSDSIQIQSSILSDKSGF
jgi:hypothetical protein